ncbi:MAG: hypothetical protein ACOYN0_01810 [Phycisphaerales bacterium]
MQPAPQTKSNPDPPFPIVDARSSAAQWGTSAAIIGGVVAFAFLLRWHARRGTPASVGARGQADQVTRELIAELDRRAADLEVLIANADERIKTLRESTASQTQDPLHARIYALADAGRRPIDIAKETGCPTGQVELILSLRRAATGR